MSVAESALLSPEERLRVPDRFTLIAVGPEEFRLHSLGFSLALECPSSGLLSQLFPLLDGTRTLGQILLDLDSFGRQAVWESIESLMRAGALERVDPAPGGSSSADLLSANEVRRLRSQLAFFSNFVAPPGTEPGGANHVSRNSAVSLVDVPKSGLEYQQRLKQARVAVFGVGRLGSQLIRSLAISGVGTLTAVDSQAVTEDDLNCESWFERGQEGLNRAEAAGLLCQRAHPDVKFHAETGNVHASHDTGDHSNANSALRELLAPCDVAVLCPDHFNPAEYQEFNLAALASKTTWISARLSGFELLIGPTVIPGETPCFQCLESRLKSNVPNHSEFVAVQEYLKTGRLRAEMLAITPGVGLLALEVLKTLTWFMPPATYAHLYSLSLLTLQSKLHPILRIPRCSACGRPAMPRPTIHAWQQSRAEQIP